MPQPDPPPTPPEQDASGRQPSDPGPIFASSTDPAPAPPLARDRVPTILLRGQAWIHGWFSNDTRVLLGVVVVATAVVAAIALSSLRVVQVAFEGLDIFAVLTLFLVNWLGNGGVLVPIPGARFIGLLMVFQQAVVLPAWQVLLVAGTAMALGQLSYFVAGARTAQSYAQGDDGGAQRIADETGMTDGQAMEFSPGAEFEADIVSALARVSPSPEAGDRASGRDTGGSGSESNSRPTGLRARFSTSLRHAQDRARPVLEQRGAWGMFLLCFAPTPLGTAAAYLGGLMDFGFRRYLVSSSAAKFLLTGVIVALALMFDETATAVAIPEITLPKFELPEFDLRLFELPDLWPAPTTAPSSAAPATFGPAD